MTIHVAVAACKEAKETEMFSGYRPIGFSDKLQYDKFMCGNDNFKSLTEDNETGMGSFTQETTNVQPSAPWGGSKWGWRSFLKYEDCSDLRAFPLPENLYTVECRSIFSFPQFSDRVKQEFTIIQGFPIPIQKRGFKERICWAFVFQ